MIIYVDIIFLENLILDFIILLATSIISNIKINIKRLILGSIFGATYTVCTLILEINNFLIKFISSVVIILICFGFKNIKRFLKNLGVFYLTTITFGGSSFMFLFLIDPNKVNYSSGVFKGTYPLKMTLFRRNFWIFLSIGSSKNIEKETIKNL